MFRISDRVTVNIYPMLIIMALVIIYCVIVPFLSSRWIMRDFKAGKWNRSLVRRCTVMKKLYNYNLVAVYYSCVLCVIYLHNRDYEKFFSEINSIKKCDKVSTDYLYMIFIGYFTDIPFSELNVAYKALIDQGHTREIALNTLKKKHGIEHLDEEKKTHFLQSLKSPAVLDVFNQFLLVEEMN